jgi:hypothetical protein
VHTLEPGSDTQPGAHGAHVSALAAPSASLAVPRGHALHCDWVAEAKRPTEHCAQLAERGTETDPAAHATHALCPATAAKVPSPHDPQNDSLSLPTAPLDVPGGHRAQTVACDDDANEPAAQAVHTDALDALKKPGAQSTHTDEAMAENAPAVQGTHASLLSRPVSPFADPAAHERHCVDPSASANVPTAHVVQLVALPALALPSAHGVHVAAPAALMRPPSQGTHALTDALPTSGFAVPAEHREHRALAS